MVEQTDYGGKSTDLKDIEREVKAAFDSTIKKAQQTQSIPEVVPVSTETVEQQKNTAKQKTAALPDWEQSKKQLNMRGITPETMDFGSYNPAPVLRHHLQYTPARQEREPVAQTFADVHKLASPRSSSGEQGSKRGGSTFIGGRTYGFGNGTRRDSSSGRGARGSRDGSFSSRATTQVDVPKLDFQYIDQNSVNALGLGPIPADKLRDMADAGQIWMYDPGAEYKFVVMWAPGWNAERYKRYGGAGTPSSESMSADIIDRTMEQKQSGEDSQTLITRMMAEDHGGMLSVEGYKTLPDFEYYAQIGASIQNPTYDEARGYGYFFGWSPGAEQVENIVTFSRDNWKEIANDEEDRNPTAGRSLYRYMTQDEVDVYNYLLAKEGETAAQKFLDTLEEPLCYRYGTEIAERVRSIDNDFGRTLGTGMYAVSAGFDEWGSGIRQLFSKERLPTSPVKYGSAYIRNDLQQDENELGLLAYDTVTAVSNAVPSILISYLTTPVVGAVVQGASAAGNAYNQALSDGYSTEQAATYGVLIGASEGALQYLLGGISKLGGVSSQQLLTKLTGIENGLLRASVALGIKGLSEVTEEELQLLLRPLYRSIVFGEEYDAPTVEEFVYTAVVSFAMTGVIESFEVAPYIGKSSANEVGFDFSQDPAGFGDTTVDPDGDMGYDGSTVGKTLNSYDALDEFLIHPQKLADLTENELYDYLRSKGYEVQPLSRGSFKGVSFEEGGGFKVNWGGDRILQYHPTKSSHHGGAYFKISSGETGVIRVDMNGNIIVKETNR